VVLLVGWLIVAIPNRFIAQREYAGYVESVESLQQRAQRLSGLSESLSIFPRGWAVDAPKVVAPHLSALGNELAREQALVAPQLAAAGALVAADDDAFAAAPEDTLGRLAPVRDGLDAAEQRLSGIETRIKTGERLMLAARRFDAADTRLGSMSFDERAATRVADARARAASALAAADEAAAGVAVAQLEQFAATLDLGYTLRIVNRSGVQSGVWRYHDDAPDARNYYVVVEAIDSAGNVLMLPVTSEETQRTQSVALFAIRVPQSEYENVKADKLDNGLIDAAIVGEKRRGELDVRYSVPVAGGAITEW
jgi:hypothetical protein